METKKTPGERRKAYLKRHSALKNERESWFSHWRDLNDHVCPRRGRFLEAPTESNRGAKKNSNIVNGKATWAARTLASGMMAGITSPARPWFRLTSPDRKLAESGAVLSWLHEVEEQIRRALERSNLYNVLHQTYYDLGTFGTAAFLLEEDDEDTVRGYSLPIGQYCLANSHRQAVNACYREFQMTVGQLVEQFGEEKCSPQVRDSHKRGDVDLAVAVVHVVEPNPSPMPGKAGPQGMSWRSCWLEASGPDDVGFLREGGFEEFAVLAPRWVTSGDDVYGASPGMEALGDIRALQLLEKRKAQAFDKIVNPPMKGPPGLVGKMSLLPGDYTAVDGMSAGEVLAPAMVVNPQAMGEFREAIREHENRIATAYYADLFLLLAQSEGQMTAREVVERHEEKMLQLGPVMERLQDELLDPLITRVFGILLRSGKLPPPPQELQGTDLRVEYTSVMAQAQKLLGTTSIERLASFTGSLAAVKPEVLDKVNFDELVDEYANALGTKPELVRTDEEVAAIREGRAAAQAEAAEAQQNANMAAGAKTLSETSLEGDTALNRLLGNLGGVAGASAKA